MKFLKALLVLPLSLSLSAAACDKKTEEKKPDPEPKPKVEACPANYLKADKPSFECECPEKAPAGSVWSDNNLYTGDSKLCRAAIHAGAIEAGKVGVVKVNKGDSCKGFGGGEANSIKTSSWGSYEKTFYFEGHGDGTCKFVPKPGAKLGGKLGAKLGALKGAVDSGVAKLGDAAKKVEGDVNAKLGEAAGAAKAVVGDVNAKLGEAAKALGNIRIGGPSTPVKPFVEGGECPRKFRDAKKPEFKCTCPADAKGVVYGSHPYTADSTVCAAARHAGVIPATGGALAAKASEGCASYVSTEVNGIKTRKWGKYGSSFVFPSKGDVKCPIPVAAVANACPSNFKAAAKDSITCTCPANATGSLYGSGPFTADSSICAAARHAGVITDKGGSVTANKFAGCSKYVGAQANGVKSSQWGSYATSFVFPSKGAAACPQ